MDKPFSLDELNRILPRLRATVEAAERLLAVQEALGHIAKPQQPMTSARTISKSDEVQAKSTGKKKAAREKSSRRSSDDLRERTLAYLKTKKGAPLSGIAKALKADVEATRYGLTVLRTQKKVTMSGNRATAQWHLAGQG